MATRPEGCCDRGLPIQPSVAILDSADLSLARTLSVHSIGRATDLLRLRSPFSAPSKVRGDDPGIRWPADGGRFAVPRVVGLLTILIGYLVAKAGADTDRRESLFETFAAALRDILVSWPVPSLRTRDRRGRHSHLPKRGGMTGDDPNQS